MVTITSPKNIIARYFSDFMKDENADGSLPFSSNPSSGLIDQTDAAYHTPRVAVTIVAEMPRP